MSSANLRTLLEKYGLSVTVVSRPRFFYAAFYRAVMPLAAPVTIALFPARRVSIVNSPLPRELRLKMLRHLPHRQPPYH
jgi:hypothetical protein